MGVQEPLPPLIDFRAPVDDAWYGVRLRVEEEGEETFLRVMYEEFPGEDERFAAACFGSADEVEEFGKRFRLTSLQLQDGECRRVIEGMAVCASFEFVGGDFKFYDAIVEAVLYSDHKFVDGEQVCTCTFALHWQHGPNGGIVTCTDIKNMCVLQDGSSDINRDLSRFLELSKKKLVLAHLSPVRRSLTQTVKNKHKSSDCNFQGMGHAQPIDGIRQEFHGINCKDKKSSEQEVPLGGDSLRGPCVESKSDFRFILIQNLDTDISSEHIVDFIYHQTSVLSQALVFPVLMSESYTRAIIFVDTKDKTEKILNFLLNPSFIITSWKGRPWVLTDKKWHFGSVGYFMSQIKRLPPPSQFNDRLNKIKVIREGMREFEKCRRLQKLFVDFHGHVEGLYGRLVREERKIMR